jgi:DNA modification methylase
VGALRADELAELFKGRPLFKGENGLYVLGDARELLRLLPDACVDVVMTDPPWGVGYDEYDDFGAFLDVRDELFRVMKRDSWLVVFTAVKRLLDVAPYKERFRYFWSLPYLFAGYMTGTTTPLGFQGMFSLVIVFAKGRPKVVRRRKDLLVAEELPIIEVTPKEPMWKPTSTIAALLTAFTREGDLVLDPFAGYGSIPLVCELFDRKWIAFDVDPLKFRVAERIIRERRVPSIARLKKELLKEAPKASKAKQHPTLEDFVRGSK